MSVLSAKWVNARSTESDRERGGREIEGRREREREKKTHLRSADNDGNRFFLFHFDHSFRIIHCTGVDVAAAAIAATVGIGAIDARYLCDLGKVHNSISAYSHLKFHLQHVEWRTRRQRVVCWSGRLKWSDATATTDGRMDGRKKWFGNESGK